MLWPVPVRSLDVINLPNTLLISMAGPLKRAFSRPICCTMQGEEFFLDGLVPPYRDQALALVRGQDGLGRHLLRRGGADERAAFVAVLPQPVAFELDERVLTRC